MDPNRQYNAIHPHRLLITGDTSMYLKLTSHDDAEELYRLVHANRHHLSKSQAWAKHIDFLTLDKSVKETVSQIKADRWLQYRIMAADQHAGQHIIGTVTLFNRDVLARNARLSCWLAESAEGQGYAKRAIKRVLAYAFYEWNVDSIFTDVVSGDERAERLMTSLGATLTGNTKNGTLNDEPVTYREWTIRK